MTPVVERLLITVIVWITSCAVPQDGERLTRVDRKLCTIGKNIGVCWLYLSHASLHANQMLLTDPPLTDQVCVGGPCNEQPFDEGVATVCHLLLQHSPFSSFERRLFEQLLEVSWTNSVSNWITPQQPTVWYLQNAFLIKQLVWNHALLYIFQIISTLPSTYPLFGRSFKPVLLIS